MGTTIDQLLRRTQAAYANNSYLYEFFEKKASGKEIVDFMYWDSVQPPFNEYLRLWLPKAHPSVLPALNKHIAEEENEGHSALFRKMLQFLMEKFPGKLPLREASILTELNYPG
jgi:hypothetical protein